jgi:hypothetical protein
MRGDIALVLFWFGLLKTRQDWTEYKTGQQ